MGALLGYSGMNSETLTAQKGKTRVAYLRTTAGHYDVASFRPAWGSRSSTAQECRRSCHLLRSNREPVFGGFIRGEPFRRKSGLQVAMGPKIACTPPLLQNDESKVNVIYSDKGWSQMQ